MMILNLLLQANPVTDSIAKNAAAAAGSTNVGITENISYLDFLLKGGVMIYPLIRIAVFLYLCHHRKVFVHQKR